MFIVGIVNGQILNRRQKAILQRQQKQVNQEQDILEKQILSEVAT